jgi:hypothetical protein
MWNPHGTKEQILAKNWYKVQILTKKALAGAELIVKYADDRSS